MEQPLVGPYESERASSRDRSLRFDSDVLVRSRSRCRTDELQGVATDRERERETAPTNRSTPARDACPSRQPSRSRPARCGRARRRTAAELNLPTTVPLWTCEANAVHHQKRHQPPSAASGVRDGSRLRSRRGRFAPGECRLARTASAPTACGWNTLLVRVRERRVTDGSAAPRIPHARPAIRPAVMDRRVAWRWPRLCGVRIAQTSGAGTSGRLCSSSDLADAEGGVHVSNDASR